MNDRDKTIEILTSTIADFSNSLTETKEKLEVAVEALEVYSQGAEHNYAIDYTKEVSGKTVSVTKSFRAYSALARQALGKIKGE